MRNLTAANVTPARRAGALGLLAASGLAFAGVAPSASASAFVRAQTAAYDQNTGFNVSDSGAISGPLATAESGPYSDFGGTFHAKAYAQFGAAPGPSLGVLSEMTNTYPLYQSQTPANAWWGLTLTVLGAPGSQVTFNEGLQLHDTITAIRYPGSPDNLGAQASVSFDGTGALVGLSLHDSSQAPLPAKTVWRTVTYNVGDTLNFGAYLSSNASAQDGAATADAYSTGLFALQVVTPGGDYSTDNGARFLTTFGGGGAVPEPSAWSILIVGFAMAGAGLRRRPTERRPRRQSSRLA